jgi:hypothetical protein
MAEKFNVKDAIKALVKEKWNDNESQGRAVNILKGFAFSDDKEANDFMSDLHSAALTISKKFIKEDVEELKSESIETKAALILEGEQTAKIIQKHNAEMDDINSLL